jgi:hypothetical protein
MAKPTRIVAGKAKPSKPTPSTPQPEPNWAAVKRRYQHRNRTNIAEIAEHFGIDAKRLRDIAREKGWRRPADRPDKRKLERPATLKERVLAILDGQVTQMEIELQDDHLPPPAERERRNGALARLIRGLGQIKPDAAAGDAANVSAQPKGAADDDQDRWRRELVARIRALKERLQAD